MFVVVEGIDGGGKGTVAQTMADHEAARGRRVFDLRAFAQRERRLPEVGEFENVDCIISAEPTYAWMGAAIREEIIRANDRTYSAIRTGEAYAFDRFILYRRVLLPARERGIDIIQERSVASSIVYQPIQAEPLAVDAIVALEGNRFCLAHPPDRCIVVSTAPQRAMERIAARTGKQDAAIFERLPVLERVHAGYHGDAFRSLLTSFGWNITFLDANGSLEETRRAAITTWDAVRATAHAATHAHASHGGFPPVRPQEL